jgi:transcription elongation regulator 1
MLREHSDIDRHSRWMDIKKKLDGDARYKAVGDSILREDYFYDYLKVLKEEKRERKKEKKDKKSEKKDKKDKDKSKEKDKGEFNFRVIYVLYR